MVLHASHRICVLGYLFALVFILSSCSSSSCSGSSNPDESPQPHPTTPTHPLLTEAATGQHLGNARAILPAPNTPSVLLAATFQGSKILSIDQRGTHHTLDLQANALGGVHSIPSMPNTVAALDFQGDRVFLIHADPTTSKPTLAKSAAVCKGPRMLLPMTSAPRGWLLCNGEVQKLLLIDLETLETLRSFHVGDAPSDMVLSPREDLVYVSDFQSKTLFAFSTDPRSKTPGELLATPLEPLRLIAPTSAPNTPPLLYVTHPSTSHVTALDLTTNTVRRNIDLRCPPSDLIASPKDPLLYAVCPGTGTLLVISTQHDTVLQRYEVPKGSYDLAWTTTTDNEARLLLSGGPSGKLQVWYPLSENLRPVHTFSLPWPSGPIHLDPIPGFFWVLSPQAGQLARTEVP